MCARAVRVTKLNLETGTLLMLEFLHPYQSKLPCWTSLTKWLGAELICLGLSWDLPIWASALI